MINVALALPTSSDHEKINCFLKSLKREIGNVGESKFRMHVYILINGIDAEEKLKGVDTEILNKNQINVYAEEQCNGKNDAINILVNKLKKNRMDIVHFFDDDVIFKEGSLHINIETLIEESKNGKRAVIIGSNFYGKIDESQVLFRKFLQWVFATPYSVYSDYNYFIAGCSNCCWVKDYPQLPGTSTGVAEDSYVSIYFANIGYGLISIKKPEKSEVYFEIPYYYKEWLWQQVRTFIGIEKSFICFDNKYDYYQKLFAWRYAETPKYRKGYRRLKIGQIIRLFLFRVLQLPVRFIGWRYINRNEDISWNKFKEDKR